VPWIVQDGCGIVIDEPDNFAPQACEAIIQWMKDQQQFECLRKRAGQRAQLLAEEADRQFADFLKRMQEL
jgi:hypothetical protein